MARARSAPRRHCSALDESLTVVLALMRRARGCSLSLRHRQRAAHDASSTRNPRAAPTVVERAALATGAVGTAWRRARRGSGVEPPRSADEPTSWLLRTRRARRAIPAECPTQSAVVFREPARQPRATHRLMRGLISGGNHEGAHVRAGHGSRWPPSALASISGRRGSPLAGRISVPGGRRRTIVAISRVSRGWGRRAHARGKLALIT
jgi:hypothetical protein